MTPSDTLEIERALDGITAAWRSGNVEELNPFFHPDIVTIHPGFGGRTQGREPCVEGYRDFLQIAKVHDYKESDRAVEVFGDTAVATYRFDITYELGGQSFQERGHDLFVFAREGQRWQAVWRTLVPEVGSR